MVLASLPQVLLVPACEWFFVCHKDNKKGTGGAYLFLTKPFFASQIRIDYYQSATIILNVPSIPLS
jgi:hypothetical protein